MPKDAVHVGNYSFTKYVSYSLQISFAVDYVLIDYFYALNILISPTQTSVLLLSFFHILIFLYINDIPKPVRQKIYKCFIHMSEEHVTAILFCEQNGI